MKFLDTWQDVPLDTPVWCVCKYLAEVHQPKLTVVSLFDGVRVITNGDRACNYFFGNTVPVPTVDLL